MNTSSPPLEIKHDHIDPVVLEVIRKIDQIAKECEAKYFLAGAMAREVILRHVIGRPPGRRSLDVDFGIAVLSSRYSAEASTLQNDVVAGYTLLPQLIAGEPSSPPYL